MAAEYPPEDRFDRDEDGLVINGEDTYKEIAQSLLLDSRPVIFPWTDQEGTRLDILMVFGPDQFGDLGEGMNAGTDLFVATRFGMFGFDITTGAKHPAYVADKLGLVRSNPLGTPLAALINGVSAEILK